MLHNSRIAINNNDNRREVIDEFVTTRYKAGDIIPMDFGSTQDVLRSNEVIGKHLAIVLSDSEETDKMIYVAKIVQSPIGEDSVFELQDIRNKNKSYVLLNHFGSYSKERIFDEAVSHTSIKNVEAINTLIFTNIQEHFMRGISGHKIDDYYTLVANEYNANRVSNINEIINSEDVYPVARMSLINYLKTIKTDKYYVVVKDATATVYKQNKNNKNIRAALDNIILEKYSILSTTIASILEIKQQEIEKYIYDGNVTLKEYYKCFKAFGIDFFKFIIENYKSFDVITDLGIELKEEFFHSYIVNARQQKKLETKLEE